MISLCQGGTSEAFGRELGRKFETRAVEWMRSTRAVVAQVHADTVGHQERKVYAIAI